MARTEILLTSEEFVRSQTNVSDNVAAGYLVPAIREAQDMYLQAVIGTSMLDALKARVAAGTIDGVYEGVMRRIQYYLAYQAIVLLIPKVSAKIANAGLVRSGDDNLTPVTGEELQSFIDRYQVKADHYCRRLQEFVCANSAALPELDNGSCAQMRANLTSAATCGLWLGGARGKLR